MSVPDKLITLIFHYQTSVLYKISVINGSLTLVDVTNDYGPVA